MKILRTLFHHLINKRRKEIPFLIFFFFLITFAAARIFVHLSAAGILPEELFLNVGGVHIHHLSYGIFILAITGYLFLVYPSFTQRYIRFLSFAYGVGLALTFDEFGMWIHLRDDYWIRTSYDAIIVISALFMNVIYFKPFWFGIGRALYKRLRKQTFGRHN